MPTTIITPDRVAMRRADLQPGGVLDIKRGSHTGDALLTTVATVAVPGGIIGPSGIVQIDFSFTSDATTGAAWDIAVQFDGTDVFARSIAGAVRQHVDNRLVANAGAEDAQSYRSASAGTEDTGDSTSASTLTTDTSHDFNITAQIQLNAADTARTITCEYLCVKILGITGE